jgi:hypothetical protein
LLCTAGFLDFDQLCGALGFARGDCADGLASEVNPCGIFDQRFPVA